MGVSGLGQLLEGLQSPVAELTADDWRAIRQEALAKVKARQKR
jgi:hypothetical protein